jgi:SAM-dependent MidA family methyltransferase
MMTTSLQQRIIDRIADKGPLTFADYMRMALYEPGSGYYVGDSIRAGWEGDFYTSTDVSDFFAHCAGRQLYQMWEQLGHPAPFVVLEQGAGRGNLARGVRTWAAQSAPDFYAILDYRATDINTGYDALKSPGSTEQADTSLPPPAVILSNELVDAFPVHRVEKRGNKLYEVYVTALDDRLVEMLEEPSSPAVAEYLDTYAIPWTTFEDGWRAEINLDALHWIEHSASLLRGNSQGKHGFLFTIDYGDEANALYIPERQRGTLACYFRHQLTEQPLTRPGEQDITAHVNFTALQREGKRQGLHLHTFTTQEQWLKQMGIHEELTEIRARDFPIIDRDRGSDQGQVALFQWYNLRQQVAALLDPNGMGNFKVLIMQA